ncbi:MAG: bifunctional 5,10-methylenetetrahydrofolate dehydrogenase/5,10-methenyltetrahydrofolate cyclohydrolase [Phycisphaerales bacterium JB039]
MPARLIDGKALAREHRERIGARVAKLRDQGRPVRLDAVLVETGHAGARMYAENQGRTCERLGIGYKLHRLPAEAGFDEIAGRVLLLNTQDSVHAIMLHMPLPQGVDPYEVQRLIDPDKDVEGVNPANIGNVVYGRSSLAPCTALATLRMIQSTGVEIRGKRAVVVGAGDVVGKPIAVLLMRHEATVISCNIHTQGLLELARSADILVGATGVPELIRADWVKPGAIVVDVGVSEIEGPDGKKTVGDVAFDEVREVASWLSPVPGGVGPMTVAMLLSNVVDAAESAPVVE